MLCDDVPVGGSDLEGGVWKIHLDVFAEVSAEPFLLSGAAEVGDVFLEAGDIQQLVLRGGEILFDNHIVEEDAPNVVVVNASSRTVLGTILARGCPEIGLEVRRLAENASCWMAMAYVVH